MRRLAFLGFPVAAALLATACTKADDADDVADTKGEPVDATEGEPTEGETDGETEGVEPDPDDPLAVCRELPAAASWLEGEPLASSAASTEARIAAAGGQTWPLALQLLRVIGTDELPSVAASPASMYAAMGLAYGRWQGAQCGDRIAEVMAFPELEDDLHATLGASIRELEARALPAEGDADPVAISMRQSVWEFRATSLGEPSQMLETYGAARYGLGEPNEDARDLINCVIEAQSQGLLPDFLPEGQPAPDTVSYDVNVAWLQAPWATAMEPRTVSFHYADGSTADVQGFGSSLADVRLHQAETFTAVELDLRGGELAMMAVVPADPAQPIEALVDALEPEALAAARDEARHAIVDLSIPKVKIEPKTLDYNTPERLDFQCEPFTLRAVFHAAAVEIDEKGIKAAAATAAESWDDGGAPEPELTLTLDRPFVFFVYDRATSWVLYSGRYNPVG